MSAPRSPTTASGEPQGWRPFGLSPWIFFLPVLARMVILAFDHRPYFFLWDSVDYLHFAEPGPLRPIGYSHFTTVCRALSGGSLFAVILAQSAVGVATACVCHTIARRHLRLSPGLASGVYLFVGLWPMNIFYEHAILSETLFCFGVAVTLLWTYRVMHEGRGAGTLGLLLAATIVIRGLGQVLVPAILISVLFAGPPRRLSRRLGNLAWVGLAMACVLVPYMSLIHHNFGIFGVQAFRGRTMFPYVAKLLDPEEVDEPAVREVIRREQQALRMTPNEEIRWSPLRGASLAAISEAMDMSSWDPRFDGRMAKLAETAILNDPVGYAGLVRDELVILVLDTGGTPAVSRIFQSTEGLHSSRWPGSRVASAALDRILPENFGYRLPRFSPARLRRLAIVFEGRLAFFALALLLVTLAAWRRRLTYHYLVVGLFLAGVTFTPILLQEYYGRYFMPAINLFGLLIALGLRELPCGRGTALVAGALALHVILAAGAWPRTTPSTWDWSQGGSWGSCALHRVRWFSEIGTEPTGPGGATALKIRSTLDPGPGGAWVVIPSDPDNDGTPPDGDDERERGRDLSSGLRELVFDIEGSCAPELLRIGLVDANGLRTSGAQSRSEPSLARYLPGGATPGRWQQVRIPLSAFPRYDGGQEPGSGVGIVDFAAITDVVFLLEQPDPEARGREECMLRVSNLRFLGEREVLWCVTDDTFP